MEAHEHDSIVNLLWVVGLGKALVEKGVLTTEEIIAQFQLLKQAKTTPLLQAEIDRMISSVEQW